MTPHERRLLAALLRCAATSGLHKVTADLAPCGRLNNAAWAALYESKGNALAAANAMEMQATDAERAELEELAKVVPQ